MAGCMKKKKYSRDDVTVNESEKCELSSFYVCDPQNATQAFEERVSELCALHKAQHKPI